MTYKLPDDCCSGLSKMDFLKADLQINWLDQNLWFAALMICFNPLYWNVLARWEYRSQSLSRVVGSRSVACGLLAASIFFLGVFRDMRFKAAMESQTSWYILQQNWALWSGYALVVWGTVLVVTSFLALGFYGTFLGDYFGILMENRVTGFPFNIMENPMYWGSTFNFLGCALIKASQAGIFLTVLVALVYKTAILLEGPFTTKIYEEKLIGNRKLLNKQA